MLGRPFREQLLDQVLQRLAIENLVLVVGELESELSALFLGGLDHFLDHDALLLELLFALAFGPVGELVLEFRESVASAVGQVECEGGNAALHFEERSLKNFFVIF